MNSVWSLAIGNLSSPIIHMPDDDDVVEVVMRVKLSEPPPLRTKVYEGPERHCLHCGNSIPSTADIRSKHCSVRCRDSFHSKARSEKKRAAAIEKRAGLTCGYCKEPMPAESHGLVKYCSTECQRKAIYQRKKERYASSRL
jgi:predicted nucleic acid-binding Zn ribbon protein